MIKIFSLQIKDILNYLILFSFVILIYIVFTSYISKSLDEINISNNNVYQAVVINGSVRKYQQKVYIVSKPSKIVIPKIRVNAKIEGAGLDNNSIMIPPESPENVTWFNLGPKPGEIGSSVLAGHFGWKGGIPAVFDNISKLKIKDKIFVYDEAGREYAFQVRKLQSFDKNAIAEDVFISNDKGSHLNLITCEGIWNKDLKSYSKRLVVFADRI